MEKIDEISMNLKLKIPKFRKFKKSPSLDQSKTKMNYDYFKDKFNYTLKQKDHVLFIFKQKHEIRMIDLSKL